MQGNDSQDSAPWSFSPEDSLPQSPSSSPATAPQEVTWTASEYIAHHKGISWYMLLIGGGILASGLVYLLTKDWISTGGIVFASVILGIFAARQPQVLQYKLDSKGITMGQKFYGYGAFKSFAVLDEIAFRSVMLLPLKRFMPPISIYYDPADEQKILETLSVYLPIEEREADLVDRLMHKIRF